MKVCVYCGSRAGVQPVYGEAARTVGTLLGQGGHGLVYGGGNVGLMGLVADAALAAGASVVGVIPQALVAREVGHTALSEQHVVPDMHTRKRLMAEHADAFLAMPGGIGTLEELYEVWTWRQLGYHDKPIGLLNVAGFYDPLLRFMDHCVAQGFLDAAQRDAVMVDADPLRMLQRLSVAAEAATAPDDYSQT